MSRPYADYRIRARPLLIALAAGMTMVPLVLAVVYWRFAPFPARGPDPTEYPGRPAISAESMPVRQIKSRQEQYLRSGTVSGQPELSLRMPIDKAMDRVVQEYRPEQVDRPGGEP